MAITQANIRFFSDGENFSASILNRPISDLVGEIDSEIARVENSFSSDYLLKSGGTVTGDLTVGGNLTVQGSTTQVDSQISTADTLILLNSGETGAGVTAGFSGIEVDRGTAVDFQFGFDEATDTFQLGKIGDLKPVATRELSQTNNGVMQWDASTNSLFSTLPTVNDSTSHSLDSGTLNQMLSHIGKRIKAITGKSDWKTAPATTLQALYDNSINASFESVEANEIIWEDGVNRITNNDGGGNVQIRFGHQYDTSDVYTHVGTAFYIGGSLDSSTGNLQFKVASNGGAGVGQSVTWGSTFEIEPTRMTFGNNEIWHAGNDGAGSGLDADTVDGVQLSGLVQTGRVLTAGDGLTGGGNLGANRTFAVDSTVVRTSRTITAGQGLTGGGNLGANRTINLQVITAGDNVNGALAYNALARSAGRLYSGGTAPVSTTRLNYDGYLYATRLYATSSRSLKNIDLVETHESSLDRVLSIGEKGVSVGSYKGDKSNTKNRWLIAEDVQEVSPEVVSVGDGGRADAMDYNQLIPDLYAAIYKLNQKIQHLEEHLDGK